MSEARLVQSVYMHGHRWAGFEYWNVWPGRRVAVRHTATMTWRWTEGPPLVVFVLAGHGLKLARGRAVVDRRL